MNNEFVCDVLGIDWYLFDMVIFVVFFCSFFCFFLIIINIYCIFILCFVCRGIRYVNILLKLICD